MLADALLARLASTGSTAVPLIDLPELLELDDQAVADVMVAWLNAGSVELWPDCPTGPACVLSSMAADRLGFVLDPDGPIDLGSRWIARSRLRPDRLPREWNGKTVRECDLGLGLDGMRDRKAVNPARAATREYPDDKATRAYLRAYGDTPFRPHRLLGLGASWPVADRSDGSCGVCGGRRLGRSSYCLWCSRSGLDAILPAAPRICDTKVYAPDPNLAGGVGKRPPKPRRKPTPKPGRPRRKPVVTIKPTSAFDLNALRASLDRIG